MVEEKKARFGYRIRDAWVWRSRPEGNDGLLRPRRNTYCSARKRALEFDASDFPEISFYLLCINKTVSINAQIQ